MKKKIFISYSHQDKAFVEWLVKNLNLETYEIWYDQAELHLGDSIKEKINKGIQASSIFIIILSKSSEKSQWVKYELNSALLLNAIKQGIRIIPIKIDDSIIPSDLSSFLYADFSSNREKGLELLKRSISESIEIEFQIKDWSNLDWHNFENLIYELLIAEDFEVLRTPKTRDGGYDFLVKTKNKLNADEKIIVETKFYREQKISIDILRRLYGISVYEKVTKVLLITNSELTNASRNFLVHSAPNLIVWEGHELINKLSLHPNLIQKYFPTQQFKKDASRKIVDDKLLEIQGLIKKLDNCPEGKTGWKDYENVCIEILDYLFVPPLGQPKIQSRRESGIDIRDAIYPNRNNNENWRFIREDYDAKYIVFEFKNYSSDGSDIDKQEVLQIDDYLKKTIGRFGIICSKKTPNKSGQEKRKDIFIEHNKLILFINNDDLKEMLLRKYKKMDPSDVIIDKIDEFNLKF